MGFSLLVPSVLVTPAPILGIPAVAISPYTVWNVNPDWSAGFVEEVSYRTEIIRSRDGTEQRIAQRVKPRHAYEWRSVLFGEDLRTAERRLSREAAGRFIFPNPRRETLIDRGRTDEQNVIGRFEGGISVSGTTDRVGVMRLRVAADPTYYVPSKDYGATPQTFNGAELFTLNPNWASPPNISFQQAADIFDYQRGVTDFYLPENTTARLIEMEYLLRDEATENAVRGLFARSRGSQRSFYVPDPMTTLFAAGGIGGTALTISGLEPSVMYLDDPTYRNVQIETTAGTYNRRISGVSRSGQNSLFTLSSSLPTIAAENVLSVRWLLRCRFETDTLQISWITDTTGRCNMTLRSLEDA